VDPRLYPVHQVTPGRQGSVIDRILRIGATQPTMPKNMLNPTSNEDPELVGGEIVGVEDTRIRVRLDSGEAGFVTPPDQAVTDKIQVGHHATFRIVATDPDGPPTLAFAEGEDGPVVEQPFDREVVRLHNALANHRPSNSIRAVERVHLGEEQIQNWIGRVEGGLGRFRKNRAKRLNEEFYSGS
jgi:hypothetical protein